MAQTLNDDDSDKPLDPAVERVRRKLVRFVAINLGLLFLALMAVVIAIVYRANRVETPPAAPATELPVPAEGALLEGAIALPQGARVVGQSLSGSRLSLHVTLSGGGQAIFIYDIGEARLIGRFDIEAAQ